MLCWNFYLSSRGSKHSALGLRLSNNTVSSIRCKCPGGQFILAKRFRCSFSFVWESNVQKWVAYLCSLCQGILNILSRTRLSVGLQSSCISCACNGSFSVSPAAHFFPCIIWLETDIFSSSTENVFVEPVNMLLDRLVYYAFEFALYLFSSCHQNLVSRSLMWSCLFLILNESTWDTLNAFAKHNLQKSFSFTVDDCSPTHGLVIKGISSHEKAPHPPKYYTCSTYHSSELQYCDLVPLLCWPS